MVSDTRLYGAGIALTSGLYSVWMATTGSRMGTSGWLMLLLGVVVVIHGVVLLTPYAGRLGASSGPLMIVYAVVMLLNQGLLAAGVLDPGTGMGMNDGMGMGGSAMTGSMSWDAGMVALALLMLLSGLVMSRTGTVYDTSSGM